MKRKLTSILLTTSMILMSIVTVRAGGPFESFDITGAGPSPIPGHLLARVIPIKWDARSMPIPYRVNNTLDPIPNPLGPAFLSVAQVSAALQDSWDAWNDIPTSYVNAQIVGTTGNLGLIQFDMINELTFRTAAGFGAIASSPSTNLIQTQISPMDSTSMATATLMFRRQLLSLVMLTLMVIMSFRQVSTKPGRFWTTTFSSTPKSATASDSPSTMHRSTLSRAL